MAKHNNAQKTTVVFQSQSYDFPSKAEADHFLILANRVKRFEIDKLSLQPEFRLTDTFIVETDKTKSGKSTVTGLKYTPDFKYYENGKLVIVEVKGRKTKDYKMRLNLFLSMAYSKYGVDTFIEVTGGKETRYECSSVITKAVA